MPLSQADLDNGKANLDHWEEMTTSSNPTSTDRLGQVKPTLKAKLDGIDSQAADKMTEIDATVEGRIEEVTAARDDALAAQQASADNATAAGISAMTGEAFRNQRASTAAALADATLANGALFTVPGAPGALSWPVYRKDSGVAFTDMGFPIPSANALELSARVQPVGTVYVEHDQYSMVGGRVTTAGVRRFGHVHAERYINGFPREEFEAAIKWWRKNSRYMGVANLPYDIIIYLASGQSNREGADAIPLLPNDTTPVPGVMMMDSVRPRLFTGTRGLSGLTPAIETTYSDGSGFNWGTSGLVAFGATVMKMIEVESRSNYETHRKMIVPVSIGRSGSMVEQFGIGNGTLLAAGTWSDTFTSVVATMQAIKDYADANGLTVGIRGGDWAWGAEPYVNNSTSAYWESEILRYWNDVDTHITTAIFGQEAGSFPIGIHQTFAHSVRGHANDPYGAIVERKIAAEQARFDIINPEGPQFLEVSGVHHSAREQDIYNAVAAMWFYRRCLMRQVWPSLDPVLSRVSATQARLTLPLFDGFRWTVKETGLLTLRRIQPGYGLVVRDITPQVPPVTPPTIAQTRQPLITNDEANGVATVDIFTATALPAFPNAQILYSGGSTYGNLVMVPKSGLSSYYGTTALINAIAEPLERWMPIVYDPIPA